MFTGLVEEMGKIENISKGAKSVILTVNAKKVLADAKIGDSIAVNGVCLTVTALTGGSFTADVMPETVDRTVLSRLKPGDSVNLERTLRVGDRLGGHIVSGHVDGIGIIVSKETDDNAVIVRVSAPPSIMRYVIKKGSISIDGTSLTIVDYSEDWFTVSLIPHTAAQTVLGLKKNGEYVNLEADIIGKYVERLLGQTSGENAGKKELTWDFFNEHGFR